MEFFENVSNPEKNVQTPENVDIPKERDIWKMRSHLQNHCNDDDNNKNENVSNN